MAGKDVMGILERATVDEAVFALRPDYRVMLREVRRAETMINRMTTRPGTKL